MLLIGSGTSWTAMEAPLPANGSTAGPATLSSVTCPSTGACVVAGNYTNNSTGYAPGMLLTGSGSSWNAVEAPLPTNASVNGSRVLSSVTCTSTTACAAAGWYFTDPSASSQGLLLSGPG
jgi:hypothetical protein